MTTTETTNETPTDTIEDIEIARTGQAPLRFRGSLLTTASGQFVQTTKDRPNSDYYTVSIYRVAETVGTGPVEVVEVIYTKLFRGTQEHRTAIVTTDPAATLGEFDPLAVLIGFPPHAKYAERQQMLETRARRQFEVLVSAVLKLFPAEIGDIEDGLQRGQNRDNTVAANPMRTGDFKTNQTNRCNMRVESKVKPLVFTEDDH